MHTNTHQSWSILLDQLNSGQIGLNTSSILIDLQNHINAIALQQIEEDRTNTDDELPDCPSEDCQSSFGISDSGSSD